MRRKAVLSLIASCTLAACAHQTAPSAMAGMTWASATSAETGGDARLAFGAPDTDNVVVMMTCAPRSGIVAVSTLEARAGRAPVMTLASRGDTSRHAATAMPSGLGDGVLVEARAPAAGRTLARFAKTGELAVAVDGRRLALPGAGSQARRFVEQCRV